MGSLAMSFPFFELITYSCPSSFKIFIYFIILKVDFVVVLYVLGTHPVSDKCFENIFVTFFYLCLPLFRVCVCVCVF